MVMFYRKAIGLSKRVPKWALVLIVVIVGLLLYWFWYRRSWEHFQDPDTVESGSGKPKMWCYWETLPGKKKPGYIDLCYDSVLHNCGKCFDVILLDEKRIHEFLTPDDLAGLPLDKLSIPHKTDYYRYALLEKYGGVWIDADIIVTRCLCPLYQKMMKSDKDYMGFGCGRSRASCHANPDGKGDPTNWLMMSKPKTGFMKCVRENAAGEIVKSGENGGELENYHAIGKMGLKKCIAEMPEGWDYLHLPSTCQEYDDAGNKLNNIMRPYETGGKCEGKRYFFPLYNTAPGYPEWFKELSKEEIMQGEGPQKYYLDDVLKEAFGEGDRH